MNLRISLQVQELSSLNSGFISIRILSSNVSKVRQNDPEKSWKITEEDWRNRNKWEEYKIAVDEMLQKTSTINAQWTVVESNDKRYSRIKILKTVAEALEKELKI